MTYRTDQNFQKLNIDRFFKVITLAAHGATEGERSAALARAETMAASVGLSLKDLILELRSDPVARATSGKVPPVVSHAEKQRLRRKARTLQIQIVFWLVVSTPFALMLFIAPIFAAFQAVMGDPDAYGVVFGIGLIGLLSTYMYVKFWRVYVLGYFKAAGRLRRSLV